MYYKNMPYCAQYPSSIHFHFSALIVSEIDQVFGKNIFTGYFMANKLQFQGYRGKRLDRVAIFDLSFFSPHFLHFFDLLLFLFLVRVRWVSGSLWFGSSFWFIDARRPKDLRSFVAAWVAASTSSCGSTVRDVMSSGIPNVNCSSKGDQESTHAIKWST